MDFNFKIKLPIKDEYFNDVKAVRDLLNNIIKDKEDQKQQLLNKEKDKVKRQRKKKSVEDENRDILIIKRFDSDTELLEEE